MVDIYGRSVSRGRHADLSKYATVDQLRNEIDDLLNLASVDKNEVVVFQDKEGRLMTSNVHLPDILVRVPTADNDNIVTFSDQGGIKDSGASVNDFVKKVGDVFTGAINMGRNKIIDLGEPTADTDAATKKYVDDQESKFVLTNRGILRDSLDMNNNNINNLADPRYELDAVTKKYADNIKSDLSGLRSEYLKHVELFLNFRRNINKPIKEFFGEPSKVDIKLAEINTKLENIEARLNTINRESEINDVVSKINPATIPHSNIRNIVYEVEARLGTWTYAKANTFSYIPSVSGLYMIIVNETGKIAESGHNVNFKITTTNYPTNIFSSTLILMMIRDVEEIFKLEIDDKTTGILQYIWHVILISTTSVMQGP